MTRVMDSNLLDNAILSVRLDLFHNFTVHISSSTHVNKAIFIITIVLLFCVVAIAVSGQLIENA